ncbi:MAG: helix-turn-helix domain-containing protein [Hyphomicrobiales bacterium]
MMPTSVRTPAELRAARDFLGLSAQGLARMVGVDDGRTIRRWEAGERELPGSVIVMVETALGYVRKIEMISKQLEPLKAGEMRFGVADIAGRRDETEATIDRLTEAKKAYEEAYEMLTRQPPPGQAAKEVHWYHLRRMTPEFDRTVKDDWSLPGELSPSAALAYFEKHEGFSGGLELCDDDDFSAEFTLEQRALVRRQYGASQGLSAGELVKTFFVRRRRAASGSSI